jgi:hypothetical protein
MGCGSRGLSARTCPWVEGAPCSPATCVPSDREEAQNRHPNPTPDDIAAAVAAEAALPYRKRTEAQLRRNFEPLAMHLPQDIRSKRKRVVQREQRAWNRANPRPLPDEMQRALTAEFVKTLTRAAR